MVAPIELYKEQYPQLQKYDDFTIARELYQDLYTDEYSNYSDFEKFFLTDPKSLETERFGRRADLVNIPEDQQTTTMGEDLIGGFKKGFAGEKTTGLGILAGVQGLIGDEEDQEYYLQKAREAELAQAQIVPGFQSSKQAYEQEGISGLTGHLLQNFGVSFPWMAQAWAGSLAGAYAGSKIGALAGGVAVPGIGAIPGAVVGGILGATAVLTPKFFGTNILRQDQSHRAGERVDINEFAALMSAPAQAAADSVLYALLPRWLRQSTPKAGITGKMLKGGAVGVPTEAATEVFQQFIERAQAGGLEYATSEEAMKEYAEAGFVGGVLGGVIGGATGPLNIQSKQDLEKVKQEALAESTKPAVDMEAVGDVEEVETVIPTPTVPEKAEVEPIQKEEIKKLKEQGKEDGRKLFIGDELTKKIQEITDTQGEEAAKEYYKGFAKEFALVRRTKAPAFEAVTKKVKFKPKGPQVGQSRFEVDEVKTEQFIDGKGFVVRDNKRGGEDSLAFRTKEQAQAYIDEKGKPTLTKADVLIPKKPAEGFAWDSDKQQWVDKWEGQRGTEELADLTEAELKAAKVVKDKKGKETFTAGAINLTDLTPKQKRLLFEHRNRKNFRKDPEKFNFTLSLIHI